MDDILTSVKKSLGISEDCDDFDTDIIMHINSVLATLTQLGVGPEKGLFINVDDSTEWNDFIPTDATTVLGLVQSYMYVKVRLLFDPPLNSVVTDVLNRQANEYEWRIQVAVEELNNTA